MSPPLRLAVIFLGLLQLHQCVVPGNEKRPTANQHVRTTRLTLAPSTQTMKPNTPSVKYTSKITESPTASKPATKKTVKEFPLNEIFFKGRETNEANKFFKENDRLAGKSLERVYEQAREQDLNEIEDALKRRFKYLY